MRAKTKRLMIRLSTLFVLCIVFTAMIWGGFSAPLAYAETDSELNYDNTNVLDDLTDAIIGGEPFDLSEYPFNEQG